MDQLQDGTSWLLIQQKQWVRGWEVTSGRGTQGTSSPYLDADFQVLVETRSSMAPQPHFLRQEYTSWEHYIQN